MTDTTMSKGVAPRGDRPLGDWPGRIVKPMDFVWPPGADLPDAFFEYRMEAFQQAWLEFAEARRYRTNMHEGFDWNQILVTGEDCGMVATTLARHFFGLGHAVFSTSCLFGWRVEAGEFPAALDYMPKNSVLVIGPDDGNGFLAEADPRFISTLGLTMRQKNCILVYVAPQDHHVASSIRVGCKEVWVAVDMAELLRDEELRHREEAELRELGMDPEKNPAAFRLAWRVWQDYPYSTAASAMRSGGPAYTKYDFGEFVRRAYLLHDAGNTGWQERP